MVWSDVVQADPRYQWDNTSGSFAASQSNNCGPTSVTKIAGFYNDTNNYGIENTRRLATGCCVPTTCTEQALMLSRRGVPAIAMWIDNLSELDYIVGWDGKHPIVIGVEMSRVPTYVKDHPFDGWHAMVVMKRVIQNGIQGYLINDPNFSPPGGYRPDPDRGKKFYPKWVMDYAYAQNSIRWGVVPNKSKHVPAPDNFAIGDPFGMSNMLFKDELGHSITIKAGKPIRDGWSVKDRVLRVVPDRTTRRLIGRITRPSLPDSEKDYGSVFLIFKEVNDGKGRIGYVKGVDIVDGSYK